LLFLQHSLSVDELQKLGSREDDRVLEVTWHEVASPVVLTDDLFLLLFDVSHVVDTFVGDLLLEFIDSPLDLFLLDLLPLFDDRLVLMRRQILNLLDFQHDRYLQLIEFRHLFALELLDLLLRLLEIGLDVPLFIFETLTLGLKLVDEGKDLLFLLIEIKSFLSELLNIFNFVFLWW